MMMMTKGRGCRWSHLSYYHKILIMVAVSYTLYMCNMNYSHWFCFITFSSFGMMYFLRIFANEKLIESTKMVKDKIYAIRDWPECPVVE